MRHRGVHYDTGVYFDPRRLSRVDFEPELVEHDMQVIADELNCTSVRLIGEDLDRLEIAARAADAAGLTVFFNPWPIGCPVAELADRFAAAARRAEALRSGGLADLVFVAGCEVSIFGHGLIPGDTLDQRIDWLVSLRGGTEGEGPLQVEDVIANTRALMGEVAAAVRAQFAGPVTYASGSWEQIAWDEFDYVGVDYYRAEQNREEYLAGLAELAGHDKPLLILEFGCCTYEGADLRGGMGWMVLDERNEGGMTWRGGQPPARSESTQGRYLIEQLSLFEQAGVDGAFVFTFAAPYLTQSDDPEQDFDRASYALVASPEPDAAAASRPLWRRKEAFATLASLYAAM